MPKEQIFRVQREETQEENVEDNEIEVRQRKEMPKIENNKCCRRDPVEPTLGHGETCVFMVLKRRRSQQTKSVSRCSPGEVGNHPRHPVPYWATASTLSNELDGPG